MCLPYAATIRWRVRQKKDINGSMLMDYLTASFCPCCALIQDAREMDVTAPANVKELERA